MLSENLIGALLKLCALIQVTPIKVEIEAAVDEAGVAEEEDEAEEDEAGGADKVVSDTLARIAYWKVTFTSTSS